MDYEIIYNIKKRNKDKIFGKKAIIKKCLNNNHARIKIESILRKAYKDFDYIEILTVYQSSKDFNDLFNNICKS